MPTAVLSYFGNNIKNLYIAIHRNHGLEDPFYNCTYALCYLITFQVDKTKPYMQTVISKLLNHFLYCWRLDSRPGIRQASTLPLTIPPAFNITAFEIVCLQIFLWYNFNSIFQYDKFKMYHLIYLPLATYTFVNPN